MSSVSFDLNEKFLDELFESVERAQGIVTYRAPYALFVEVDTSYDRGLKPPFQPLFNWTLRNITSDRQEAKGIAYKIQQDIFENGIEGEFYMLMTKNQWETKWTQVLDDVNLDNNPQAPEEIVELILEGILDDSENRLRNKGKIDTGELIDSGLVLMGVDPFNLEEIDIN